MNAGEALKNLEALSNQYRESLEESKDLTNEIEQLINRLPDISQDVANAFFNLLVDLSENKEKLEINYKAHNAFANWIKLTEELSNSVKNIFYLSEELIELNALQIDKLRRIMYGKSPGWVYAKLVRESGSYLLKIGKTDNINRRSDKEYGPQKIDLDLCTITTCMDKSEVALRGFALTLTELIIDIQKQRMNDNDKIAFSFTPKTGKVKGKHDYFRFFISEKSTEYILIYQFLKAYFLGLSCSFGGVTIFRSDWEICMKAMEELGERQQNDISTTISIEDYLEKKRKSQ